MSSPVIDPDMHPLTASREIQFDKVLSVAVKRGASDIHVSPDAPIAFGISGHLEPVTHIVSAAEVVKVVRSCTSENQQLQLEKDGSVDFALEAGRVRFRCNVVMTRRGLCLTARRIEERIRNAEELGVPPAVLNLCSHDKGLFLVTGQTGSGKSTTLASLVDRIMGQRSVKVITFEQPIEYTFEAKTFKDATGRTVMSLAEQQEIPAHMPSFAEALREGLRRAPNVIVVGELRDLPTMETAMQAAESGHLVLATLHNNTAVDSISRIVNSSPEERTNEIRTLLATNLIGVLSQVLVPRADGGGRVLACEYLVNNAAVQNAIRENKVPTLYDAIVTGGRQGMQTMEKSLFDLVNQSVITEEQAILKAPRQTELRNMLQRTRTERKQRAER
jgi:twitching motility protein PilT